MNVDTTFLTLQLENYLRNCRCGGCFQPFPAIYFLFWFYLPMPTWLLLCDPICWNKYHTFLWSLLLAQEITFISREETYSWWRKNKAIVFLCNRVSGYWNTYKNKRMCVYVCKCFPIWNIVKIIELISLTKWILMNMLWKQSYHFTGVFNFKLRMTYRVSQGQMATEPKTIVPALPG